MSTEDRTDDAETDDVSTHTDPAADVREGEKIRIENVTKQFGRIIALEDVSLTIREDEIFALIGDNGAGKSTLMNVFAGVHKPTEGEIYYEGNRVTFSNPSDARDVGIETVYQDLALMDDLDIASNIYMGKFPTREIGPVKLIDWDETYARADAIIHEQLEREMNVETEVEFLSGGQRQLVAIGRALAFNPDVIILDEPTSALSVNATELVHRTFRRLRDEGHTILIVSHNIENVLGLADRIGVLHQGKLVEVTDVDETDRDTLTDLMVTGQTDRE